MKTKSKSKKPAVKTSTPPLPPRPPAAITFLSDFAEECRMIYLHQEMINNIIYSNIFLSAQTFAIMLGFEKGNILQKDAYARFGNKDVKRWHKAGLLHPKRIDGCIYFPLIELYMARYSEIIACVSPNASREIVDFTSKMATS